MVKIHGERSGKAAGGVVESKKQEEQAMEKQQEWTERVQALLCREDWIITNLANAAAAIWEGVERINWAGFYLLRRGELQLGPFQGKPACVRIPLGRGVCGTAAAQGRTVVVRDVHAFAGHIACDAASASEIVVPIRRAGQVVAVLDIDSPEVGRFGEAEQALFEQIGRAVEQVWPEGEV